LLVLAKYFSIVVWAVSERVARDRNDFRQRTARLGEQRDGGAPDIVKVQFLNSSRFAGLFPFFGKVAFLEG
jgi:hypothetical protein